MRAPTIELEEQHSKRMGRERYSTGIENLNITRIWDYFLHGNVEAGMEQEGLDALDQRAIIPTRPGEKTVVRRNDWDRDLVKYLNSIQPKGLGAQPENIFAIGQGQSKSLIEILLENDGLAREILGDRGPGRTLQTYHNSDLANELADKYDLQYLGSSEKVSKRFGNKVTFRMFTHELNRSVPDYRSVRKEQGKEEIMNKLREYRDEFGSLFIRGTKGAGGRSTYEFTGKENISELVDHMLTDTGSEEFLVEPHLNSGDSRIAYNPSILYRIVDDEAHIISPVSGQIIVDNTFIGNFYPSGMDERKEKTVKGWTKKIIEEQRKQGYRGEGGLDFVVTNHGWIVPGEDNTRVTGASPAAYLYEELTERFGKRPYFLTFNEDAGMDNFADVSDALGGRQGLLYTGKENEGVLPILARYDGHVISAVFSETPERTTELARETSKKLGIEDLHIAMQDQITWYDS